MPTRARLIQIVNESSDRARIAANNLRSMTRGPKGLHVESVEITRSNAHQAIDRAADAASIVVAEQEPR